MNIPHRCPALLVVMLLLVLAPLSARAQAGEKMTPLLLAVHDAPVPFTGSDGRVHLVYELWMSNSSSAGITVKSVEVLGDGSVLQTLDSASISGRLQPLGQRESTGTLPRSTQALLFVHVALAPGAAIPHQLSHRVWLRADAAPPQMHEMTEDGGTVNVDRQSVVVIAPPLRGERYISADSCCDSTRHMRATLPVNGRMHIAQRYAVDWEQANADGRIYSGPQEKLESYTIFGQPALAVADARVIAIVDGLPEGSPGKYPTNLPLDEADGNSVILDLGNHRYAMYAHLQPGSIKVHKGDSVKTGQIIGLVGDTGNSLAPHLHFQVMDAPSSLGSNGLPYEIDSFEVTGKTPGTEAFDDAEAKGTPLAIAPVTPPQKVNSAMPLDQLIITFPGR